MRYFKLAGKVILLLLALGFVIPGWTPPIKGDNSISTLERVEINGTKLAVMIRGADRSNPVVIFVHGGPGCSEIPYVRKYQDLLEEDYTIVHYDQRGSGKSYHFFEDYSNLSTDLHVEDLLALTDYITDKLGQSKVLLIGHSFGTYIGMKAASKAPVKFAAYMGIGQVADTVQSELDSLEFTMNEAAKAGNAKDVQKLEGMRTAIEQGEELTPRSLVRKYGGAARRINDNMDYYLGFLFQPEYNFLDVVRYVRGVSLSQDILITEEKNHPITSVVKRVEIPIIFIMGKYDYMTSANVARAYYDTLEAPKKEFILFDQSAHYPQFEEEEQFAARLKEVWRALEM